MVVLALLEAGAGESVGELGTASLAGETQGGLCLLIESPMSVSTLRSPQSDF